MKKITLTNFEVLNIVAGIQQEIFANKESEFSLKFAWKLRKNTKILANLNEAINEKLAELERPYADDEHSEAAEDGNRQIKQEYALEFAQKRNELYALENEVEINMATVDEIGAEKISPNVLNLLSFMLEDDE